jgi:hypothetical protein
MVIDVRTFCAPGILDVEQATLSLGRRERQALREGEHVAVFCRHPDTWPFLKELAEP